MIKKDFLFSDYFTTDNFLLQQRELDSASEESLTAQISY
jgi:hypothetical protein